MLTNSYIHLPGIGATTKRKIWDSGIKSWDEFREENHRAGLPESKLRSILEGISTSKEKLKARNHIYFANNLPSKEHWRAYREFKDDTIFLDIETTGLSPYYNKITMIGVHGSDGTVPNESRLRKIRTDGLKKRGWLQGLPFTLQCNQ